MSAVITESESKVKLTKPFWVVWALELWERFGYYGVQAIFALYFVRHLGFTERQSFDIFGSFSAFTFGFVWVGGWIGDNYLGTKRTMLIGAIFLTLSYFWLAVSNTATIYYALGGIIVGNSLFKANPSSLISKIYAGGSSAVLDSAMTMYYMAINVGSMLSLALAPIVAEKYGWDKAFLLCAFGLLLGVVNYIRKRHLLDDIGTPIGRHKVGMHRYVILIVTSIAATFITGKLLTHTELCNTIVYLVVGGTLLYFLKVTFSYKDHRRTRMLIAFTLILEGVMFFVLYNQMPTSITFFAVHNTNNFIFGLHIPPAEYQVLNSVVIIIMSPILVRLYYKHPATHITKFCFGMTLCAIGFLVLALPQYTAVNGLASPGWLVLSYFLQSTGELLISGLGLAMVAELCPQEITGFVMGVWFLSYMLAGPIGAWLGNLTTPSGHQVLSSVASLHLYGRVFFEAGLVTSAVALLMWLTRPYLNRLLAKG